MALAALLGLGACKADGGGFIGEPLRRWPRQRLRRRRKLRLQLHLPRGRTDRAVIRGHITYHDSGTSTVGGVDYPAIRLHGIVDPFFTDASTCEQAAQAFLDAATFDGTYRPQGKTPGIPGNDRDGRFTVIVYDQGEPARPGGRFTGDGVRHRTLRGRLRRLHPGRLHRGRQRPGEGFEVATSSADPDDGQPMITSSEGLDVTPESGSSTRSW